MKLSIIVPCYNVEKYIKRCIDSILDQKNHTMNLEILLCNDGSKDNTLQVINSLQKFNSNSVKVIDHPNQGVYKTRNNALNEATGDFIWLIDADDSIEPNSLYEIEKSLKKDLDILSFGYRIENPNKIFEKIFPPDIKHPITGIEYLNYNDGRLFLWFNIYKRDFLNANNLRFLAKSMSLEDSFFNIQAFTTANRVYFLHKIVYNYYFNEDSISKKPTLENRLKQGESSVNVHLALKKYIENFKNNKQIYNTLKTKLNHTVLGFFFSLLKEKYPINYISKILNLYKKEKLYPISYDVKLNQKAKAFRFVVNNKRIFLFLCKINLIRK